MLEFSYRPILTSIVTYLPYMHPLMVSNPVFTETEKPDNPDFFFKTEKKTVFWLPVNPVFRFWILT